MWSIVRSPVEERGEGGTVGVLVDSRHRAVLVELQHDADVGVRLDTITTARRDMVLFDDPPVGRVLEEAHAPLLQIRGDNLLVRALVERRRPTEEKGTRSPGSTGGIVLESKLRSNGPESRIEERISRRRVARHLVDGRAPTSAFTPFA